MLTLKHTFIGHSNPIYSLANSDKPGIFFSAGNDKGIVEWSLTKMAFVMVKWPVKSTVYCLEGFNNQLFSAERNGQVMGYDFLEQSIIADFKAHEYPVFCIKILKSKKELITASEDGTVSVWSLGDFKELFRIKVANDTVRTIAISPDEQEVAFGCKDNEIRIYNSYDFSLNRILSGHTMAVTSLAYSPDGKRLISGSRDAQVKIWDKAGEVVENIPAHLYAIYDIAFHPTLSLFATCSQDKSIKIWNAESYALNKILSQEKCGEGHSHSVNKIIWTPDGQFLLSAGDDRKILLWELSN